MKFLSAFLLMNLMAVPPAALGAPADLMNSAYIDSAWRPLVGPTVGSRIVFNNGGGNLRAFAESQVYVTPGTETPYYTGALPANTSSSAPVFDYNGDGSADFATIQSVASGLYCGNGANRTNRTFTIFSGAAPATQLYVTSPIPDPCISLNGAPTSPYLGLYIGSLQYGASSGAFALIPQYYANGWFLWNGGSSATYFYTPETASFAAYNNDLPMLQPSAGGLSYQALNQPLNGLMVSYGGGTRYVATASGRFMNFAVNSYSAAQLLGDRPFLARTDIVGRTYGLLQHDTDGNAAKVMLIAGVSSVNLFNDVVAGYASNTVIGNDPWGALERHISSYDLSTNTVQQNFYSYAPDPVGGSANGYAYRHRITFPPFARVPSQNAAGSRMVFNVYNGSTWNVHFTTPGGVVSSTILSNYYVWDMIRRDANTVDLIMSPVDTGRMVWVPNHLLSTGYPAGWRQEKYFPQMKTEIFRWTRAAESMALIQTINGGIPYMGPAFPNAGTERSSEGFLYPSVRSLDAATDTDAVLILRNSAGGLFEAVIN